MLNLLFLSELFYPHGGGAELATYLYAKLLSCAGFNVIVVTNRFGGEPEFSNSEGFAVYRLPLFGKVENVKYSILKRVDVLLSVSMLKLLKWADVVYVPRFWFSAIPLAKALDKPVIVHLHDYIPICPLAVLYNSRIDGVCEKDGLCSAGCVYAYESGRRKSLVRAAGSTFLNLTIWPILERFVECSDVVVCVSKAQRDILVKYLPSLGSKVRVIYNPLPDLSLVEMNGDDFGYFGGPSCLKGFHVLLKALRFGKREGLKSAIVHATKFSDVNRQFAGFLGDLGFAVYRKLDNYEYDRVYRKIRAVIAPSIWHEPSPYVVAEALMKGRLVIASRVGGIPEQVAGCNGALLFDAGNWKQLAEIMDYASDLSHEVIADYGIHNREVFARASKKENPLQEFKNVFEVVGVSI